MDINSVFAAFEQRIDVLGRLMSSLGSIHRGGSEAFVTFLEHRASEQSVLLAEWARAEAKIEAEIEPWRRQCPDLFSEDGSSCGIPSEIQKRWLHYRERHHRLLVEIHQKCLFQGALLRRARRTAVALSSLLSGIAPTYAPSFQESAIRGNANAGNLFVARK